MDLSASSREQFLQRLGHQPLAADAAVVGGDDVLVADGGQPVGPEQQVARPRSLDGDHTVAAPGSKRGRSDRSGRCRRRRRPSPPCRVVRFPKAGPAGRSGHAAIPPLPAATASSELAPTTISTIVIVPACRSKVGDGQRDAFAAVVGHDDHEMARAGLSWRFAGPPRPARRSSGPIRFFVKFDSWIEQLRL